MAAVEVRGTGQKKEHFQVSKESDTELHQSGGVAMASRDNSGVLGRKKEESQASHWRMLQVLSSTEDWVNLFTCKNLPGGKFTPLGAKREQQLSLLPFVLQITVTATYYAGLCAQNRSSASLDASSCSTHINMK